jgi:hypothetical protein
MLTALEGWTDPPRHPKHFYRAGIELESLSPECWAMTKEDMLELRREAIMEASSQKVKTTSVVTLISEPEVSAAVAAPIEETKILNPEIASPSPCAPGVGMRLSREIKQLICDRRAFLDASPSLLPLAAGVEGPMLLKGVASRVEIDIEHTLLMSNALHWDELPPLRLRHGSEPVGEIIALEYSRLGDELRVECRVDDLEAARMPAFSICFTPETYELIDRGGKNFFFKVTRARLDEVSLTENPALRSALVERRCPTSPNDFADPRYRKLANGVARLRLALAA